MRYRAQPAQLWPMPIRPHRDHDLIRERRWRCQCRGGHQLTYGTRREIDGPTRGWTADTADRKAWLWETIEDARNEVRSKLTDRQHRWVEIGVEVPLLHGVRTQ